MMTQYLPDLIAHADWSVRQDKRWLATAQLDSHCGYQIGPLERVSEPSHLLADLRRRTVPSSRMLVGFDFPIGLPASYARLAGIKSFLSWLPEAGSGQWADFFSPAQIPEQIRLERPFYPLKPGNARQTHLLTGLGIDSILQLRRVCELAHPGRRAAAPLFWTLGGQQVGKAAICGWRDLLQPALNGRVKSNHIQTVLWPFSGDYISILQPGVIVLVESYPAEYYSHLEVNLSLIGRGSEAEIESRHWGKRSQVCRQANAPVILKWAETVGLSINSGLEAEICCGFGSSSYGEDRFDALIGLFGIINIVLGFHSLNEPFSNEIRQTEGWIFGQEIVGSSR